MNKAQRFLCSMLLFFGMVCFSNTAFASQITNVDNFLRPAYTSANYLDEDDWPHMDWETSESGQHVKSIVRYFADLDEEDYQVYSEAENNGFFRSNQIGGEGYVWLTDADRDARLLTDYHMYAGIGMSAEFTITSDFGRIGEVEEASFGSQLESRYVEDDEFVSPSSYMDLRNSLYDLTDNSLVYDFSKSEGDLIGTQDEYEQWLDTLEVVLYYGHEYRMVYNLSVFADNMNDSWDRDEILYQARFYNQINLGDETDPGSIEPVPEPATMLLLGTGLVGLAGLGRRKFFKK